MLCLLSIGYSPVRAEEVTPEKVIPAYEILSPQAFSALTALQINEELLRLEAAYPGLLTHSVIGKSVNGCPMFRISLTGSLRAGYAVQKAMPSALPLPSASPSATPVTTPSAVAIPTSESTTPETVTTPSAVAIPPSATTTPESVTTPSGVEVIPPAAPIQEWFVPSPPTKVPYPAGFVPTWVKPGKKTLLIEAGTHARETPNPYIAYRILATYAQDAVWENTLPSLDTKALLQEWRMDVVVLSNPDGYELVKFGKKTMKAARILKFLSSVNPLRFPVFKASATGVDLNRNYPSLFYNTTTRKWVSYWGKVPSRRSPMRGLLSKTPASQFYAGTSPGSEPETQAMMRLIRQEDYRLVLSLHSQGNVLYSNRPWLSKAYNASVAPYAALAARVTGYSISESKLKDSYSGFFGDYVANETLKPCITLETTRGKLPADPAVFMEAFHRCVKLPYLLAEKAGKAGRERYRLVDKTGRYVRDMSDLAYARALAVRYGWTVKDAWK